MEGRFYSFQYISIYRMKLALWARAVTAREPPLVVLRG